MKFVRVIMAGMQKSGRISEEERSVADHEWVVLGQSKPDIDENGVKESFADVSGSDW